MQQAAYSAPTSSRFASASSGQQPLFHFGGQYRAQLKYNLAERCHRADANRDRS